MHRPSPAASMHLRMPSAPALAAALLGCVCVDSSGEQLVQLPTGGHVGLSTRGPSAFRVRLFPDLHGPVDSPMVAPDEADAPYSALFDLEGEGIAADGLGSVLVSPLGELLLRNSAGTVLTKSQGLAQAVSQLSLSTISGSKLYGRGASPWDAQRLTADASEPLVCNRATYTPYYYSTDGYGALGVTNATSVLGLLARYAKSGPTQLTWTFAGAFELYLLPAPSLAAGTAAYYRLAGAPAVLPRYAFGFAASRWGWTSRSYIEATIARFRDERYPIDAIIVDFEWFTPESDYAFTPAGKASYLDFGFNNATFDEPRKQLARYFNESHIRMAGIRKPRLGNTELLNMARSKGWILPNGEPGGAYPPDFGGSYAHQRNLDFSQPAVRSWYAENLAHFYDDGVSFWWNDEGETSYFTFHWWNVAEIDALRLKDPNRRFYSLNRAWSPGMARLGAAVWTGDVLATWEDLAGTPGMMLNWVIGGAPYVGCDIGGFGGETTAPLLTRWIQVGVFMPIMRVHSVIQATPHFPWNFGEAAAVHIRQALELRYRLLPYHYSLAHALFANHSQWIRPLVMDYPGDAEAAGIASQWMDGAILVAPVLTPDSQRQVYLPEGIWYELQTSTSPQATWIQGPAHLHGAAPADEVPAFVRAGSILPLAPVVQHSDELPGGPLEVQVYAGADCSFELVEDDGETTAYRAGGVRRTRFEWEEGRQRLSWRIFGQGPGRPDHLFQELVVVFIGKGETRRSAKLSLSAGGFVDAPEAANSQVLFP